MSTEYLACRPESTEVSVMHPEADAALIRRAFEASDLAALRAALDPASGDPELAALGPVAVRRRR